MSQQSSSNKGMAGRVMSRRSCILLGLTAASAIVGSRIAYVNATAEPVPEEIHHAMGDWVELGGAFLMIKNENTQGLSIRLNSASRMSYNEYIANYANDGSKAIEGRDAPSVVDLQVTLKNERDDAEGRYHLIGMKLIRRNSAFQLVHDPALLTASQRVIRESGNPGVDISIEPHSSYDLHFAYVHLDRIPGMQYIREVSGGSFGWYLSNYPVRHIIDVSL